MASKQTKPQTDEPAAVQPSEATVEQQLLQEAERPAQPACRVCGCTELDCSGCVERTGQPCWWVEPDLCSACSSDELAELSGRQVAPPVPPEPRAVNQGIVQTLAGMQAELAAGRDPMAPPVPPLINGPVCVLSAEQALGLEWLQLTGQTARADEKLVAAREAEQAARAARAEAETERSKLDAKRERLLQAAKAMNGGPYYDQHAVLAQWGRLAEVVIGAARRGDGEQPEH